MKRLRQTPWMVAPLFVGCALALRFALNPFLGSNVPYAAFILAVVASSIVGGSRAGFIALVLGGLAADYFFVAPVHKFLILGPQSRLTFGSYLLVSGALLWLMEVQFKQKAKFAAEAERRREAEATERALRERFEITLSSMGDGVISTDSLSRVTFMNDAAAALTGWDAADAAGLPLEQVFRKGRDERGPTLISKDGRERPVDETTAPIKGLNASSAGSVLIFRDVSGIRERDAAIARAARESEHQFRTLADSIPQLAWVANDDGHIFWYNRRWYEYTGSTPEEMEGWGWQSVHDQTRLPEVLKEWRKSIETQQPFDMVIYLRGADGRLRPFLTRVMPVRDELNNVVRWFGTNTDITERQETEDRLRASDERFRRLYEADVVGIICLDTNKIFEANDVFLQMLGYSRGELLEGRLKWRDLTPAEYQARDEKVLEEILKLGSCRPFEKELIHKDGHAVPILVGATLLDRDPAQCLCVVLDLTERKQLERKVLEAQKLDSVGLLAGGVAHDFNNMLVGVIGSASLASEMVSPGGEVAYLLDNIMKTGEQLAHLTRQMLAYAGKGRFFIEPLDLSELATGLTKLVRTSVPRKIELKTEWAGNLPAIEADRGQLQQIFTNLVLNAAEAIQDKAGAIWVRTGVRDLDDHFIRNKLTGAELQAGRYVYLEVEDSGCGMDAKTKARIFDPFFSTKFTGRGLGLAAVAGIVRSHKGAIAVETVPGSGTTFTVFMPAAAGAARPPQTMANGLRGSGTVLVVDDEPVVREMARRALERYGYQILLAESGKTAIDLFKRHPGPITVAVLDLSMPSMGGDETLPRLHGVRPAVKFIVSSGHSEVEAMALFKGQRIAGYLQKPYTAAVLAATVARALDAAPDPTPE